MQVGKRTTLTNNDRVLLSRLIDAYGRSQIIEEISMSPKPRAGRPMGAIGAAVMFALTWLVGGHFPKS
jgi:hypothetical protein